MLVVQRRDPLRRRRATQRGAQEGEAQAQPGVVGVLRVLVVDGLAQAGVGGGEGRAESGRGGVGAVGVVAARFVGFGG